MSKSRRLSHNVLCVIRAEMGGLSWTHTHTDTHTHTHTLTHMCAAWTQMYHYGRYKQKCTAHIETQASSNT